MMMYLDDRREGRDAARRARRGVARMLAGLPSVLIHPTDPMYASCSALTDAQLVRRLRSMTSGVLITTRPSLHVVAAQFAPSGLLIIAQEHMNAETRPMSLWRSMIRASPGLDAVVTLTKRDRRDIAPTVGSAPPLVRCIPNASPAGLAGVPVLTRSKVVVAAGRLKPQKGFDRLIEAFGPVADSHPDWRLHIYGKGPRRSDLQRMIDERGSGDQITLMGWTDRLGSVLAEASVFALSSRFEGLPLVAIEALAAGLPVVAFDCPRGPRELVRDGENGYLLRNGDVTGYSAALSRLLEDEELRQRLGETARADAAAYEVHEIGGRWQRLIDGLVTSKASGMGASRKRPGPLTVLRMAASLLFVRPTRRVQRSKSPQVPDKVPK
jgi:glycosyltransferase involved in cell wall biosynthesis